MCLHFFLDLVNEVKSWITLHGSWGSEILPSHITTKHLPSWKRLFGQVKASVIENHPLRVTSPTVEQSTLPWWSLRRFWPESAPHWPGPLLPRSEPSWRVWWRSGSSRRPTATALVCTGPWTASRHVSLRLWWICWAKTTLHVSVKRLQTVPSTGAARPEWDMIHHWWVASGVTATAVGSTIIARSYQEIWHHLTLTVEDWVRGIGSSSGWSRWPED